MSTDLTHEAFVEAFETCTLPALDHCGHVRLAWWYLQTDSVLGVLEQFRVKLQRFATSKGAPNLYHETITWVYILTIHDRMQVGPSHESWPDFATRNPDLFIWPAPILATYYHEATLASDRARQRFILPDRFSEKLPASA